MIKNQAIDRAFRLSRRNPDKEYFIVYDGPDDGYFVTVERELETYFLGAPVVCSVENGYVYGVN